VRLDLLASPGSDEKEHVPSGDEVRMSNLEGPPPRTGSVLGAGVRGAPRPILEAALIPSCVSRSGRMVADPSIQWLLVPRGGGGERVHAAVRCRLDARRQRVSLEQLNGYVFPGSAP
jgi:hypothetical protein